LQNCDVIGCYFLLLLISLNQLDVVLAGDRKAGTKYVSYRQWRKY